MLKDKEMQKLSDKLRAEYGELGYSQIMGFLDSEIDDSFTRGYLIAMLENVWYEYNDEDGIERIHRDNEIIDFCYGYVRG